MSGPIDEELAYFDSEHQPTTACYPDSIEWNEYAAERERIERELRAELADLDDERDWADDFHAGRVARASEA